MDGLSGLYAAFFLQRHVDDRNVGLSPMQIYLCGSLCVFSIHSFPSFFSVWMMIFVYERSDVCRILGMISFFKRLIC